MEDKHFDKVYYFVCVLCSITFVFDILVCFVPVPTGGQKYADILVGSLNTGALTSGVQYLLGGTPQSKKPEDGTVTGQITGTISNEKSINNSDSNTAE